MTSTEIAPASIEHLDHHVACTNVGHKKTPPPAAYYFDQHGCIDGFLCTKCLATCERVFADYLKSWGAVGCPYCKGAFTSLTAFAKVVSL